MIWITLLDRFVNYCGTSGRTATPCAPQAHFQGVDAVEWNPAAAVLASPRRVQPTSFSAREYYIRGLRDVRETLRQASRPDERLTEEEAASTLFRFVRSKHVGDLRVIFLAAGALLALHAAIIVIVLLTHTALYLLSHPLSFQIDAPPVVTYLGYIGTALPIYGGVMAWAYLSASRRLGIVDLFACEINTLCRVGTILDIGALYAKKDSEQPDLTPNQPSSSRDYSSQEDYFPIYGSNSGCLQSLESLVVINITAFYTYMKATRDLQRKLAEAEAMLCAGTNGGAGADRWRGILADLIFMLFLGYESGRKAIEDLIEYEPTKAETRIVILLTELVCYSFLCKRFENKEPWCSRLKLREPDYKQEVPELYQAVMEEKDDAYWLKAKRVAAELALRYEATFGESIDSRPRLVLAKPD